MKRGWKRRILILCAALLLCVGMLVWSVQTEKNRPAFTGRLSLWYAENDCPTPLMDALMKRCREKTGLWIEATAFENQKALGEAFEKGAPDLLYCSHLRAEKLAEQGSLEALPEPVGVTEPWPWVGLSFFPLGSHLPLLLVDTARAPAEWESLEELYAAEDGPRMVSDDWSELLFTALYNEGYTMRADEQDRENETWLSAYNALAEAVFRGAIVGVPERAADYVRSGAVPCAVTRSTNLAGLTGAGLRARLLPPPAGREALYPAELMGFALLRGADTRTALLFAPWLESPGEGSALALKMGLVPWDADAAGKSGIEESLAEIAGSGLLRCLPGDTLFYENREVCEEQMRAAFDLLR